MPETGVTWPQLTSFDALMRVFLRDNQIPGGALAVTQNGRLIYARGFGFADVERQEPVQPNALFRIASISKPITAVALLQLVDQHRVKLDDRVLDLLQHQAHVPAGQAADEQLKQITVGHLLQHRGGWDRKRSFDPMFSSRKIAESLGIQAPAMPDDIVSYMLGRHLDFEPGARYAYSNLGYCLLGRVIEQISGEKYESFVRHAVLDPIGVHRLRIGRTLLEQRCEGEVKYYTPGQETGPAVVGVPLARQVPLQYGCWSIEAMDAHGGWIGSAIDLVRFASQVQPTDGAGLLSAATYAKMIACPPGAAGHAATGEPKDSYYGLGWQVRPVGSTGKCNLWHTGALPGTSALLVVRHDGLCWAALFNTSYTSDQERPASKIDRLIHVAAGAVKEWPQRDLFHEWLN